MAVALIGRSVPGLGSRSGQNSAQPAPSEPYLNVMGGTWSAVSPLLDEAGPVRSLSRCRLHPVQCTPQPG
jgi:hypothetical protein